jgi:5-methylcytosine-specific restriction endonuclease McrA
MPEVMRRFCKNGTFATEKRQLTKATEYKSLKYAKRVFKPNPYSTQERIQREELPPETYWTGYERRPGMEDIRPLIMKRDEYTCQGCGKSVTSQTCHVDHKRPVRRFRLPINANHPDNLWTLCIDCHRTKTETDRLAESRML